MSCTRARGSLAPGGAKLRSCNASPLGIAPLALRTRLRHAGATSSQCPSLPFPRRQAPKRNATSPSCATEWQPRLDAAALPARRSRHPPRSVQPPRPCMRAVALPPPEPVPPRGTQAARRGRRGAAQRRPAAGRQAISRSSSPCAGRFLTSRSARRGAAWAAARLRACARTRSGSPRLSSAAQRGAGITDPVKRTLSRVRQHLSSRFTAQELLSRVRARQQSSVGSSPPAHRADLNRRGVASTRISLTRNALWDRGRL